MATPVPYRWISGLPPQAQKEIERDFLHIQNQVVASATGFDAWLDSSLTTSNAATHTYKNFGDLIANEVWVAPRVFRVGVKATTSSTKITEASNTTIAIPGPLVVTAANNFHADNYARQWAYNTQANRTRQVIDMNGSHFTSQGVVTFDSLHFVNTGAGIQYLLTQTGGYTLVMRNCVLQGTGTQDDGTVIGQTINQGTSYSILAYDTCFVGCDPADNQVICFNCHMILTQNLTMTEYLYWDGGIWEPSLNGVVITLGDTHIKHLRVMAGTVDGAGVGNNWKISTTSSQGGSDLNLEMMTFDGEGAGTAPDFLQDVTLTGRLRMRGVWRSIVANNPGTKDIDVYLTGSTLIGILDLTGPARVRASCETSPSALVHVILRGANVRADLACTGGAAPQVQGTSLTDSLITMTTKDSSQAVALDAGSTRNVVVLGGAGNATETPPGYADSGTNNRIITYNADTALAGIIASTPSARGVGGPPGVDGQDGEDGWPGPPGQPGATGSAGPAGQPGPVHAGVDGQDGEDGWPGPPGAQGPIGSTGPAGAPGVGTPGVDGADGEDGYGFPGQPGPQGIAGATGARGAPGDAGEDGLDGFGFPGATGSQGPQGIQGIQGIPGQDGADGEDGFPGPLGPPGVAGSAGAAGAPGVGTPGVDGGDGEDGYGFPGPQGIQGVAGPQGIQGIPGQDGADGEDGFPGHPGSDAPAMHEFLIHAAR